ncbi:MAG: hypothetical protein II126_00395 [Erysipelotrichaceae bacterium]|nr:hypothetical protein [Erysipelotrichaceae bacterium]
MANRTKANTLQGMFIHHDDHNRTIFYDILTSKGYQIGNDEAKWYVVYSSLIPLYFAVIYFGYDFFGLPLIAALVIGIGLFIAAFLIFRFTVIYKLPVVTGFKPESGILRSMAQRYSSGSLILLIALLLPLVILTPLYAYNEKFEGLNLYAMYGITAFEALFLIAVIIALVIKKKEK